jgi:hypothetical protein
MNREKEEEEEKGKGEGVRQGGAHLLIPRLPSVMFLCEGAEFEKKKKKGI